MLKAESPSRVRTNGWTTLCRVATALTPCDAHEIRSSEPSAFNPSRYFGFQTTKRAGLVASPQEASPLRTSLY